MVAHQLGWTYVNMSITYYFCEIISENMFKLFLREYVTP